MKIRLFLTLIVCLSCFHNISAQESDQKYFPPTDSLVMGKLAWWQDMKFGLLMHWGTYSQWGIVESWSLCPEDESWCERKGPYSKNYFEYKQAYESLIKTFNPIDFDPLKWAKATKDAGMKYVIFTAKHHDGFCMFDTKQTDYKITNPICPFSLNPRANVAKEIFNAFRNEGFGVGAYFSKPDWHCPDYWNPYFPPFDRNPNYDLKKYPEKWNRYKEFTYNQIKELMTDYGKIDILWLDGGWVQPMTATSPRWGKNPVDQNVNMPKIAEMARGLQLGLIIVDRAVEGPYQNYLTPEQQLPSQVLSYPWETCMTMATSWSYVPNDIYKPTRELIHLLCKIVSRGGNFLLNIAPGPSGDFDQIAYNRLKEIGGWMKVNGEAIYGTKPVIPYQSNNIVFTSKGSNIYAIYLVDEKEEQLPSAIVFEGFSMQKHEKISILGSKKVLSYKVEGDSVELEIPGRYRKLMTSDYAVVFRISK